MKEVIISKEIITKCDYCANDCEEDLIVIKEKNYCCYGCATLDDVVGKIKHAASDISIKYKQYDLEEYFN